MTQAQPAPPPAVNPANTLGIDYRAAAARFSYRGPIIDVHTHLMDAAAADAWAAVADLFGVTTTWSQTPLPQVPAIRERHGDRIRFIAVPNYAERDRSPTTFTSDWIDAIRRFAEMGCTMVKLWAAPRGRDFSEHLRLDSPIRVAGVRLAIDYGMQVMVHVADPDTWFATKYADVKRYGRKREHYAPLERLLDQYPDVLFLAAHMGGSPEDLDFLQGLLDRHANLHVDTSATKWMVRELSKHPLDFRVFCRRNPGRVHFGTDIVANAENAGDFDLHASRYWALRTLLETDHDGPSPIVDPDLHLVDPQVPEHATARLRGAALDDATLRSVYHDASAALR